MASTAAESLPHLDASELRGNHRIRCRATYPDRRSLEPNGRLTTFSRLVQMPAAIRSAWPRYRAISTETLLIWGRLDGEER